jgi:hypothetical protein
MLGSVAAAGLSTGAYAADLGVLTSLDLCDDLGISGLTISSDTNCLAITGEVKYKFVWGDYAGTADPDAEIVYGDDITYPAGDDFQDWESRLDSWIQFVASANSDFGIAKAVIKLKDVQHKLWEGTGDTTGVSDTGSDTGGVVVDEAYVSIGDTTVLMAGKKGSILNKDDDSPLNWLGLFHSESVDEGVGWGDADIGDGGHVIQVTHDLGNGVSIGGGLENLNNSSDYSETGTAVGVLAYAGDGITAHASFAAAGILDGVVEDWAVHAGFTGTFDMIKVVGAAAWSEDSWNGTYWNVLGSVAVTFDMFELAVSGEATSEDEYGVGGSVIASVTDGVKLKGGARWFQEADGDYIWEGAVGVEVAVTESVTLEASAGYVAETGGGGSDLFYGKGKASWAPGGNFTASLAAEANSESAYKITSEFAKTFE